MDRTKEHSFVLSTMPRLHARSKLLELGVYNNITVAIFNAVRVKLPEHVYKNADLHIAGHVFIRLKINGFYSYMQWSHFTEYMCKNARSIFELKVKRNPPPFS